MRKNPKSKDMIDKIVAVIEEHGFAADSDTWNTIQSAIQAKLSKYHPYHIQYCEYYEYDMPTRRGYHYYDDNVRFDTAKEAYEYGKAHFSNSDAFYIMRDNKAGQVMILPWGDVVWIPLEREQEGYHGSITTVKLTDGLMYQCKSLGYSFAKVIGTTFYNDITPGLYKEQTGRDLQEDIDKYLEDAPGSFLDWDKGTWRLKK
jgi:hypothetical protein